MLESPQLAALLHTPVIPPCSAQAYAQASAFRGCRVSKTPPFQKTEGTKPLRPNLHNGGFNNKMRLVPKKKKKSAINRGDIFFSNPYLAAAREAILKPRHEIISMAFGASLLKISTPFKAYRYIYIIFLSFLILTIFILELSRGSSGSSSWRNLVFYERDILAERIKSTCWGGGGASSRYE